MRGRQSEGRRALRAAVDSVVTATGRDATKGLAQKLGISREGLRRILIGAVAPSIDTAVCIEAMTGIPIGSWREDLCNTSCTPQRQVVRHTRVA